MKAVILKAFGDVSNLSMGRVDKPLAKAATDVLIKVKAVGLNRADILQRQGKYPPPPGVTDIIGLECVGEVAEACGPWKAGDRVMTILAGGGYAEYAVAHTDTLLPIPERMSFVEAAAVPEAYLTAFQLLHLVGRMQPADRVLIHAGASGVGTAATQLARLAKASRVVTTSSSGKLEYCRENGATLAVDHKEAWAAQVKQEGEIDLVLDPVAGAHVMASLNLCARDARYVLYAAMAGVKIPDFNLIPLLQRRIQILPSTLRNRDLDYKINLVRRFAIEAYPALEEGQLQPVIDSVYPLDAVAEAHKRMEANLNSGKIVLEL